MKLQIKETYKVNGIEYSSIEEARKAAGIYPTPKGRKRNHEINFNKPFQTIDVSKYKISEYMGKMSLKDANELANAMSNENIIFWVPTYSEMISLIQNGRTNNWNDHEKYWTSTVYNYSTYIYYDVKLKEFEDMFPDLKYGIRFLFKEN